MIAVFTIFYLLYHYAVCRELPYELEQDQEYCVLESDYPNLRSKPEVKHILKKVVCAAKIKGEYIKKISECYSDIDHLKSIKASAKEFLQDLGAEKALIPMARCLGTMKIKAGDDDKNKKQFHDCMANNDFENKIETTLKQDLSDRELTDFEEFMECLSKSEDDDEEEVAQDCIDTNPILYRIIDIINGYIPYQQYSQYKVSFI